MKKIILAQPRGFCAGVKRAIDIVERAIEKFGSPIYVRHEIVHNKHVVDRLSKMGAIFVDEVSQVPKNSHIIFSAHGVSNKVEIEAQNRDLLVVDATCPLVKKVHIEASKYASKNYKVLLVGHKGHPEVEGTSGRVDQGIVLIETVEQAKNINLEEFKDQLAYVTQTTLSVDDTREIIKVLKHRFPDIKGPDTRDICYATQNRQKAVRKISELCDVVLVLGNSNSSNSVRLAEIASIQGIPSYRISNSNELNYEWVNDANNIGITAGASTPEVLMDDLIGKLKNKYEISDIDTIEGIHEKVEFKLPEEIKKIKLLNHYFFHILC